MGEPGTVLNGARELTNWVQSGNLWYSPGQTQQGPRNGECQTEHPRCSYPEQLFINRELLDSVATLGQVGTPNWSVRPGDWYFDYNADRIYIPYNPSDLTIETSVTLAAFEGTADNVTINGIRIEMYVGRQPAGCHQRKRAQRLDRDQQRDCQEPRRGSNRRSACPGTSELHSEQRTDWDHGQRR